MPVQFSTLRFPTISLPSFEGLKARFTAFKGKVTSALQSLGRRTTEPVQSIHSRQVQSAPGPIKSALAELQKSAAAPGTSGHSEAFDDLAHAISHSVQHADQGAIEASVGDLSARLADLMRKPSLLTESEVELLKDPPAFMGKLFDAAVAAAPELDQATVRSRLGFIRLGDTFRTAFATAVNSLGDVKQRLIDQRVKFEPKLLNSAPTLADLPVSLTSSPDFKNLMGDLAHALGAPGSLDSKQALLQGSLLPRLQALLNSAQVPHTTKLALTLSDGQAFMESLRKEIVSAAPVASRPAVNAAVSSFVHDKRWHELYHAATVNLGDKAEGFDSADKSQRKITINGTDYHYARELGGGNFGQVQLFKKNPLDDAEPGVVVKVPLGHDYASKVDAPAQEGRELVQALGTGASAQHLAPLQGAIRSPSGELLLILPLAAHGSLDAVTKKIDAAFRFQADKQTAAQLKLTPLVDLAQAMERLQLAKGQLHLDVATRNVLIDDKGNALLTDFGMTESVDRDEISGAHISAPKNDLLPVRWTAPERLKGGEATTAADTWMFGMTLYEVVYGTVPFATLSNREVMELVTSNHFDPARDLPTIVKADWPNGQDAQLRDLLVKVLQTDPAKRPSMDEILRHPALNSGITGTPAAKQMLADVLSGKIRPARPAPDNSAPVSPQIASSGGEANNYNLELVQDDAPESDNSRSNPAPAEPDGGKSVFYTT